MKGSSTRSVVIKERSGRKAVIKEQPDRRMIVDGFFSSI